MRLRELTPAKFTLTATVVAVTFAGCGGSGDKGLSKGDLTKQANAICATHGKAIDIAAAKVLAGGKLPTPQAFGKLATQTIIPQYTAQVSQLKALKASSDLARPYGEWLKDSEALLQKIKMNPMLIQSAASFKSVNSQSDALGLSKDCDAGPS